MVRIALSASVCCDAGIMSEKAQVLSWITCDGAHVDPATGKYYLLGVFSSLRGSQFPIVHPRMIWFLTLTDVQPGKHHLRIALGLPVEAPTTVIEREFESQSPLQRIHIINEIKNLRFTAPGDFSLVVEVDDDPVLVTSFAVLG